MPSSESHISSAWFFDNKAVRIKTSSNETFEPTAREIIGAEFKNRFTIREILVKEKPSAALPELKFNRFPLQPVLCVAKSDSGGSSHPCCWLEYIGNRICIVSDSMQTNDQLIHNSQWYSIAISQIEELQALLVNAKISKLGLLSLREYLDIIKIGKSLVRVVGAADVPRSIIEAGFVTKPINNIVSSFVGKLYEYQRVGVQWLAQICDEDLGCVLGDEMGLGKTVQVIALIARESEAGRGPNLIIAPATLLENWHREISRFSPSLKVCVHRGSHRSGFPKDLKKFDVVIVSYGTAVRDLTLLKMVRWNLVILDEAQAIKNPETSRTGAIIQIPRRAGIAMSGTPVENRLRDIWSIMEFACPGLLGSLNSFEQRFDDSVPGATALEPIISPLILRRTVVEVANDLPDRIDIPHPVELSFGSASEYDSIRKQIIEENGKNATLVTLTKLRQFCAHPFLIKPSDGDPAVFSTKYSLLVDILTEIFQSRGKCLIFTSYTKMADILLEDLTARFRVLGRVIDGRTPVLGRQSIIDEFQASSESAFLVLNPRAAGTGLNITAANHVVHYNLEWNPAIEDQASARAYRRGQKRPVTIHRMFNISTVEEVVDDRIQRKRLLAQAAVIGTAGEESDLADIANALNISPSLNNY